MKKLLSLTAAALLLILALLLYRHDRKSGRFAQE